MDMQTQLLSGIDAFLAQSGMAPTTFGKLAVNDGKFVSRLRGGANMTLATLERVRRFMVEYSGEPSP